MINLLLKKHARKRSRRQESKWKCFIASKRVSEPLQFAAFIESRVMIRARKCKRLHAAVN